MQFIENETPWYTIHTDEEKKEYEEEMSVYMITQNISTSVSGSVT